MLFVFHTTLNKVYLILSNESFCGCFTRSSMMHVRLWLYELKHIESESVNTSLSIPPNYAPISLTMNCAHLRSTPGHHDVIKWKYFQRYWPFVRGIHRSSVNSAYKGQWRGALVFSLIFWINSWVNNREAGDLRRHRAHYDVTVIWSATLPCKPAGWPRRAAYHDNTVPCMTFIIPKES